MESYRPGVCNIGRNEIRKRYASGVIFLFVGGILVALVSALSLPKLSVFLCVVPLFLSAEGFIQGYFRFCAGFAARSIFDFSGSSSEKGSVNDGEAHRLDMRRAKRINLYSIATAAIATSAIYLAVVAL